MNYPPATHVEQDSDSEEYENEHGAIGPDIKESGNQNREVVFLTPYDPQNAHRSVHQGMNFQGKCTNPNCNVNGRMVWAPLGYGKMEFCKAVCECPCPICKVQLQPQNIVNIGYRYAKVKFVGRKAADKNKIEYEDEERNGKLIKFNGETKANKTHWIYLDMQVDKL